MKGQIYMLLIFMVLIGIVALLFMAFTVPLGWLRVTSQTLTPFINDTDVEEDITTSQDTIWNLWWMTPAAFIIIIILWAFAHSQKKESGSAYIPYG